MIQEYLKGIVCSKVPSFGVFHKHMTLLLLWNIKVESGIFHTITMNGESSFKISKTVQKHFKSSKQWSIWLWSLLLALCEQFNLLLLPLPENSCSLIFRVSESQESYQVLRTRSIDSFKRFYHNFDLFFHQCYCMMEKRKSCGFKINYIIYSFSYFELCCCSSLLSVASFVSSCLLFEEPPTQILTK